MDFLRLHYLLPLTANTQFLRAQDDESKAIAVAMLQSCENALKQFKGTMRIVFEGSDISPTITDLN